MLNKRLFKIYFLYALCCLSTASFIGCSKDDSLMSQKEIVELTAKYRDTLDEITACEKRIAALEVELEKTPPESAYLIEEMIEREQKKLEELKSQQADLEKNLGIK